MFSIALVKFSRHYLELSWYWLNDPEIKHLTNSPDFSKEDQKIWYNSLKSKKDYKIWGIVADNNKIGVCGLKNLTSIDCEYWGYIGNKTYWGKGIGSEIIKAMEKKAKFLKLESMWLQVLANNKRAIRLYHRSGYLIENANSDIIIMRKRI